MKEKIEERLSELKAEQTEIAKRVVNLDNAKAQATTAYRENIGRIKELELQLKEEVKEG